MEGDVRLLSFAATRRAPARRRNPRTGQEIVIPAATIIKFKPGKTLKDLVR